MIVKGQRMCMPENGEMKRDIMEEAHSSAYAMHPGSTKMYRTLKEHYWWNGMKKGIASFVYFMNFIYPKKKKVSSTGA